MSFMRDAALGELPVDYASTVPNTISDVHELLGVEAAAAVIHAELTATYATGGANVDQRHVSVVVDCMVRTGVPLPFSRHGLNQKRCSATTGPLVRASFEESIDVLVNAAIHGEEDSVVSALSSSIIVGARPAIGTGSFQVLRPRGARKRERQMQQDSSETQEVQPGHRERVIKTSVAATEATACPKLGSLAFVDPAEVSADVRFLLSSPRR